MIDRSVAGEMCLSDVSDKEKLRCGNPPRVPSPGTTPGVPRKPFAHLDAETPRKHPGNTQKTPQQSGGKEKGFRNGGFKGKAQDRGFVE